MQPAAMPAFPGRGTLATWHTCPVSSAGAGPRQHPRHGNQSRPPVCLAPITLPELTAEPGSGGGRTLWPPDLEASLGTWGPGRWAGASRWPRGWRLL